jgi:translation initiation factor IF-3
LNDEISAPNVRLIDAEGEQLGIVPVKEAIQVALSAALDLVEISPDSDPPVCRIMDYGKQLFEEKKKRVEQKKKQKQAQIKEIKFRPTTEQGDYEVKLRSLTRFLNDGDKAKVSMRFKGREMAHQELGLKLLQRIEVDLAEMSVVEQHPKADGRQIIMVLAPKKKR